MQNKSPQAGLTLIEIILACFLFLLCLGVIASTFSAISKTYFSGQKRLETQNLIRTTLDIMASELREMYGPPLAVSGGTITFRKYDNLKAMVLKVTYSFDAATGTVIRDDEHSTAHIGGNITGLSFDASGGPRTISIVALSKDPVTQKDLRYETTVATRSSAELLSVRSTGRAEGAGASCLWQSSP